MSLRILCQSYRILLVTLIGDRALNCSAIFGLDLETEAYHERYVALLNSSRPAGKSPLQLNERHVSHASLASKKSCATRAIDAFEVGIRDSSPSR